MIETTASRATLRRFDLTLARFCRARA